MIAVRTNQKWSNALLNQFEYFMDLTIFFKSCLKFRSEYVKILNLTKLSRLNIRKLRKELRLSYFNPFI